ncbi:MAG: hypothetical protein JWL97_4126 [Gemmatimonadales bacterium]|nr:hypothetical protein [Gemmatimonadales bacterium]
MGASPDPVDPRNLLEEWDRQWRPRLRAVSLVAEADVAPELSRKAAGALARVYSWHHGESAKDKQNIFRYWPAAVAVALAGVAATDYEYGSYWPELWEIAGYQGSPQDQTVWGKSFAHAIDVLGMPTFPGMHQTYLGPILMHAGIPSYCLGDLFRLLLEQSRRDPSLDADSFMAWAMGGAHRLNSLDKPVQRFLQDGADYAYDTLDRILDLLNRLREPQPDLFGVGLPERIVQKAQSLAAQDRLDLSRPRTGSTATHTIRPHLALDPFGEGPLIVLPATTGTAITWRIVTDGKPHLAQVHPAFNEGEGSHTTFPLPRQVAKVQVGVDGDPSPMELSVVDSRDPLLVFTEDGKLISSARSLPPDVVWVVYPATRKLSTQGELTVVCEAPMPFGWYGWRLEEINLEKANGLGLADGPTRKVRGSGQPRLSFSEPIPGVTAAHGAPVYAEAPTIHLPDAEDRARVWHIEVQRLDLGRSATLVRLTASDGEVDPWADQPRPIIGAFQITVLGPLGYRLNRRVTVAEGLSATYEPGIRLLTPRGLMPGKASLKGSALERSGMLAFDEHRREQPIGYGPLRLLITPPHLQVLRDDATGRARWSSAPLTLTTESFADAGALLIRAPSTLRLSALQVTVDGDATDGKPLQTVLSSGVQVAGQARYELTRIKDTVQNKRTVHLSLTLDGMTVPLASVRPQAVASGVVQRGGQLRLLDYTPRSGLRLGVYAVFAPWRGAASLPVSANGRAQLPLQLRPAGPLRVLPRTGNLDGIWPYWPDDQALWCSGGGLPATSVPAEDALSRFVAGNGALPTNPDMEHLWLLCDLAERLEADGARKDLRTQCHMFLRNEPKAALLALAATRLDPDRCITQIVESGLAALQPRESVDPTETRLLWARLPSAAALLTGRMLAHRESIPELLDVVVAQCGQEAMEILLDGADPYTWSSGEADPGTVPLALLDPARLSAALRQLDELPGSTELAHDADDIAFEAIQLLETTPYAALGRKIASRPEGLPRMSAALALVARAAAWGRAAECRAFERVQRARWTRLARLAPELVSIDLILAQALFAGAERARLLEENK